MAKQLAKEIYELAKNDESSFNNDDSSDLKNALNKQMRQDMINLREKLKTAINKQIGTSNNSKYIYNLYSNGFPISTFESYKTYRQYPRFIKSSLKSFVFSTGAANGYLLILDPDVRVFIRDVIIPLDLKISLNWMDGRHRMIVGWDHWINK